MAPNKKTGYSVQPSAVKKRLRKASQNYEEKLKDVALLIPKPVDEWDFEELQRGRIKDEDGKFRRGRTPTWINPLIMAEAAKRLKTLGHRELGRFTGDAIRVMIELMESSRMDLVRFNAAKYVLDQILGQPTQRVEVEQTESEVKRMLAAVMINPDGREDIIDAEVVEEEEPDE